jgi:hypothetical protein
MKTTILTIGMMVLFCMPQITTSADSRGSDQTGFSTAMAISNLAEKEIRKKERVAAEDNKIKTAANTIAADNLKKDK